MDFLVVCYAVHEQSVASIQKYETYEQALKELMKDAQNTFEEERASVSNDANLEIDGDTATLTSCDKEYTWTWEICKV